MLHSSMVLTSSETDCFELSLIGFQKSIYFVILHTYIWICMQHVLFLDVVVNCCTWYAFSYQILHFSRFQVWVWKPGKSSDIFGLETGIFKPAFCFLFSIQKFRFGSVLVVVLKHSGSSRFCKEDPGYSRSVECIFCNLSTFDKFAFFCNKNIFLTTDPVFLGRFFGNFNTFFNSAKKTQYF